MILIEHILNDENEFKRLIRSEFDLEELGQHVPNISVFRCTTVEDALCLAGRIKNRSEIKKAVENLILIKGFGDTKNKNEKIDYSTTCEMAVRGFADHRFFSTQEAHKISGKHYQKIMGILEGRDKDSSTFFENDLGLPSVIDSIETVSTAKALG